MRLGIAAAGAALIFALVPVFLYAEFRKAYQDSQDLLLQSVRGQGRVTMGR